MSKIKIPSGRHRNGRNGCNTPCMRKKMMAAREESKERKDRYKGQSKLDSDALNKEEQAKYDARAKTWVPHLESRGQRPSGEGHFADGELTYRNNDGHRTAPAACITDLGFSTPNRSWVTCMDCLVMIDWGLSNGYLTENMHGELFDADPLNPERRPLRKKWKRLGREVAALRLKRQQDAEKEIPPKPVPSNFKMDALPQVTPD